MVRNQVKNQHLMWRAAFGPSAEQLQHLNEIEPSSLYMTLLKDSLKKPEYIDVADDYLKEILVNSDDGIVLKMKETDKEEKKLIQQKQREDIKKLNLTWLDQMVKSNDQLREKMAFFWHGHFASRNINIFYQQSMLNTIRQNALENFRVLLHEVSKSAAMLNFLNANQNRKDHPNENFAREVMELFTMGRGHYSETDIKEAARAFTGWGANVKGDFVFRKNQHDDGLKTILGQKGNFDGDDVLDILLNQKQTALFITQKVYRFFVNENLDDKHVTWLAERFYKNQYDVAKLLEDIFTSGWFYDDKNIGIKIKSPIELIAGIRRMLPMQLENEESQLLIERILGQVLFYPPNVAGWPGGKSWIDSSTLMMRMRIPQMINDQDEFNIRPKTDDDQMMGKIDDTIPHNKKISDLKTAKPIKASIDWPVYLKNFDSIVKENLIEAVCDKLLQVKPGFNKELIRNYSITKDRESFIKSITLQIMSTPEYQLC